MGVPGLSDRSTTKKAVDEMRVKPEVEKVPGKETTWPETIRGLENYAEAGGFFWLTVPLSGRRAR
jgi:hypothetical protein